MQHREAVTLLRKIADNDTDALREFYQAFGGSIFKTARRVVCEKTLAEDILNEIVFKVYREAPKLARLKNPLGYICVMTYNLAVDYKRRNREIPWADYGFDGKRGSYDEGPVIDKMFVDGILEGFDEPDRSIFICKAALGYTFYEIKTVLSLDSLSYKQIRLRYEKTKALFKKYYTEGNLP